MAAPSPATLITPLAACIRGNVSPGVETPQWAKDLQKKFPEYKPWPEGIPGIPFEFPDITLPGFPAMLLGALESLFAGITFVLDYIPPDPEDLPSIPDVSIFIEAFMASMKDKIPPMPAYSLNLEGITISIPEIRGPQPPGFPPIPTPDLPGFDPSGIVKLSVLFIALPFLIIKGIIDYILEKLSVKIPTLEDLKALIGKIGLPLGIAKATMDMFSACLASIFLSALSLLG
jgi:hypothetical protein